MLNSLKIKILGLVTIIVVAIISLAAYVNFQLQKQMHEEVARRHTALLMETIKNSINDAMRSGRSDQVMLIMEKIKSHDIIKGLRIVNEDGKILNSAERHEIGRFVPPEEREELKQNSLSQLHFSINENLYDSYSKIYNAPACFGCHPSEQKVLGIMEIELSLEYLQGLFSEEKRTSAVSTAIIICLIILTISIFLITYVDKPIQQMITTMKKVEGGDFDCRINITSSAEMRLLSDKFNLMVAHLKDMVDSSINHERELARAQEKIAHHHEIHTMNQRLEEQLREIENLNISLEERIEEIEEANYKIADLAGELEDKNTTLEKAVARLSTLYKVGLGINSTMDLEKLFALVVKTTMETLQGEIGYIILHEKEKDALKVTTLLGHEYVPEADVNLLPMKPSSVSTWVINHNKPLLVADINDVPEFDRFSALGYERKTLVCAPLATQDEIIGTITVVNKQDNSIYTNEDLELLTTIAAQASIAIKNAQLYEEQQKSYMNTIHALVSAIEASDSYTRGHSERVTRYSVELAKKVELPHDRLKVIERAAILHDIGKIGIDLTLLHKEGRLTPADIHDLQQHPLIGMRILEPIEFLNDVRLCIGQHHERYDGQGYPNNIPADQLLLESRILAIADSFDAMTSDRPYRKALPVEMAIKELHDHSGSQFDPELVPHFVELLGNGTFSFDQQLPSESSRVPITAA